MTDLLEHKPGKEPQAIILNPDDYGIFAAAIIEQYGSPIEEIDDDGSRFTAFRTGIEAIMQGTVEVVYEGAGNQNSPETSDEMSVPEQALALSKELSETVLGGMRRRLLREKRPIELYSRTSNRELDSPNQDDDKILITTITPHY